MDRSSPYVIIMQPTLDGHEVHVATREQNHRSPIKSIVKKLIKLAYYFLLLGL